jgi:phage major head subunit gpT-like protein
MDISSASLATIRRMINTAWAKGLEWKPPQDLGFLMSEFPSGGASELYPWANFTAQFREWLGDRQWNALTAELFEVANRDFEKSEKCKATLIKDDRFGVFVNVIGMYASAWEQLKFDLVIDVVKNNPLCFTGKALFANDHAYGENTLDNLVTDALTATSFEAAFTASSNWQFANGILVQPNWTHLVHGPKLRSTAFGIVEAKQISDGNGNLVDNPNYNRCARVELKALAGTYDDYWMLVDGSQPVKAIARQIREVPVPRTNDVEDVEETGEYKFMASGRAAAAPTFPHLVYGGRL